MPDDVIDLDVIGWDAAWQAAFDALRADGTLRAATPGRVARVDFGQVTVLARAGTVRAVPGEEQIATGDWVVLRDERVAVVLPRRSTFVRGDPMEGTARGPQVVAANVDVVLVVQSLVAGPNIRRLERELVLAYESRATPVVVLNKADLVLGATAAAAVAAAEASAREAAPGVEVVVTSAATGLGLDRIEALARPHRTLALIGASGVGKSTLVNRLARADVQATAAVREHDQRGRHTTTARELVLLPSGGVLIDTPGLRAVSLWDAEEGLSRTFADIEELAAGCRFANCTHASEPGCAVRAAIADGSLDERRYEHYVRLDRELDAGERRRQARIASRSMRRVPRPPRDR
jgi:ribosome biogenesis GTPase